MSADPPRVPDRTRLLVVKTGDTLPSIRARFGDFDQMFLRHLGELGVEWSVVRVHEGEAPWSPDRFDAAIITGSPASVTARAPWADHLADWIRDVLDRDRWLLGVCYGHQLLAHAAGGEVTVNPAGYEVGTIDVELTQRAASDPLLGAVARGQRVLPFHSTHQDAVSVLPPRARLLASSKMTPVQAFAIGERAWGVQFHPEFDEEILSLYVDGRAAVIAKDAEAKGDDPARALERVKASIAPTPRGPTLLRRFIELGRDVRSDQVLA